MHRLAQTRAHRCNIDRFTKAAADSHSYSNKNNSQQQQPHPHPAAKKHAASQRSRCARTFWSSWYRIPIRVKPLAGSDMMRRPFMLARNASYSAEVKQHAEKGDATDEQRCASGTVLSTAPTLYCGKPRPSTHCAHASLSHFDGSIVTCRHNYGRRFEPSAVQRAAFARKYHLRPKPLILHWVELDK